MKREEKNQKTRRKIMDSALAEFSSRGYGASSINTICTAQELSKGIVYHYFETKDALFLACVEECFQRLTEYLQSHISWEPLPIETQLEKYFTLRTSFFQTCPVYQRIFCEAVISPPAHLSAEIQRCKKDFDTLNVQILRRLLDPVSLRPDISKEDVIETFRQFQDFINIRYQMTDLSGHTFEDREAHCLRALNILLYGVIERKESEHV
ncbi:MAG: TetR/AcrR family transcriptional regulator [Faecalibacterium sp.]